MGPRQMSLTHLASHNYNTSFSVMLSKPLNILKTSNYLATFLLQE